MKAIILAAGKGTRCLPLTKIIPKVLISINKKPFLYYLLENLKTAGCSEFGIIVGHLREKITEFVKENKINATLIEQAEQLGTGHALAQAEKFANGEDFLLVRGDNLYSAEDLKNISELEPTAMAGFVSQDPERYGVLELNGNKLIQIIEKPKNPKSNLVNTGLYKFGPEIFPLLKNLKKTPSGEYYMTDAINILAQQNKVEVKKLDGYWIDLGKLVDIPAVEKKLAKLF